MILNSLPESIWKVCLSVGECHKLHSKLPQAPNTLSFFLIQLPVDHRFLLCSALLTIKFTGVINDTLSFKIGVLTLKPISNNPDL